MELWNFRIGNSGTCLRFALLSSLPAWSSLYCVYRLSCMSRNPEYSETLARWALTVQEMDVTIRHKSRKKNPNTDALSRCLADIKHESLGEKPGDVDESQVCSVEGQVKDQSFYA